MTAPDGMRALRHAGALQCALSAAAKACASLPDRRDPDR